MLLAKDLGLVEGSYYEATVARSPMAPVLEGSVECDVCVVGGGYAGLASALEFAERGYSVRLLEARRIGWGASGRNGGQVLVGYGAAGEAAIARQLGPAMARLVWDASVQAVQWVLGRIARHRIDCDWHPGYLSLAVRRHKATQLRRWMEAVERDYGYALRWIGPESIGDWIASERYSAAVFDGGSGHLHPLKYCLGLARAAAAAGVVIHEASPALHIEHGPKPRVDTALGHVHSRFLVLAGNVYLGEFGRERITELAARIIPVGTYMIATEPMAPARAEALMRGRPAASDTNAVLDYFRLSADHRLLFGSGETSSGNAPSRLAERMRRELLRVFPQLHDLAVQHVWGGFVDVTWNRAPHFGRLGSQVFFLQGFSGHGLALSCMAGQLVAQAVAGDSERFDLLARLRHRPFPGGTRLRVPALALGMLYHRLRDLF